MKRAGRIGRLGRVAIVAAVGIGVVLASVPVANAEIIWEFIPASTDGSSTDEPQKIIRKIEQPTVKSSGSASE